MRDRLRHAETQDTNLVALAEKLAEKVDGLGNRFDVLQANHQEVLREVARQAEKPTPKTVESDGEMQKHREAVEHLSSEMRQMQTALVERVDTLGKRVDTVLVQVGDITKQQSAIEPSPQQATRLSDPAAAPVASSDAEMLDVSGISFEGERSSKPVLDDDLALPDLAQLWRGAEADGGRQTPRATRKVKPPAPPLRAA